MAKRHLPFAIAGRTANWVQGSILKLIADKNEADNKLDTYKLTLRWLRNN
ncbi:hypothetical protein ACFQ5D_03915 [Paenibacillus farraposensis]|uniref:Uncharacterized protein n=1 Tax=Paenibacillus farraposensis TaxID=2807095 RepID=A0ABW4DA93_9BACL|nr:hypothetical protein [Paenibacillus farraposensis]MCC3382186.1 hypothetical protein [Paenibacillus farraposensis]